VIWLFAGFAVTELYDDFVFADYIDIDNGFIKHESGLVTVDTSSNKTWRKAEVIMVGPACRFTKVGDIILFPNDKGLPCGEVNHYHGTAKNGIFLSEHRIFAKLSKHES
jgi:co-chaperonin GroES (HSP10)